MTTEFKIRDVLRSEKSIDYKVKSICIFMTWNPGELKKAILKYGTVTSKDRSMIINCFWRS
jgi:hypothetical protein